MFLILVFVPMCWKFRKWLLFSKKDLLLYAPCHEVLLKKKSKETKKQNLPFEFRATYVNMSLISHRKGDPKQFLLTKATLQPPKAGRESQTVPLNPEP